MGLLFEERNLTTESFTTVDSSEPLIKLAKSQLAELNDAFVSRQGGSGTRFRQAKNLDPAKFPRDALKKATVKQEQFLPRYTDDERPQHRKRNRSERKVNPRRAQATTFATFVGTNFLSEPGRSTARSRSVSDVHLSRSVRTAVAI